MQSNAMYSLSFLAKKRGWEFEYYCRINENLLKNPTGNLKAALKNRMVLKDISLWPYTPPKELDVLSTLLIEKERMVVPEGGRFKEAAFGIKRLADEIIGWAETSGVNPTVVLPSGTGTTALFLQKFLPFRVKTVACVKGEEYLKRQFFALEKDERHHPQILVPSKKFTFAKPYKELLHIYNRLKEESGIEFELIYDTVAFFTLLEKKEIKKDMLYIHQGGIVGNESMLQRYKAKFGKIS